MCLKLFVLSSGCDHDECRLKWDPSKCAGTARDSAACAAQRASGAAELHSLVWRKCVKCRRTDYITSYARELGFFEVATQHRAKTKEERLQLQHDMWAQAKRFVHERWQQLDEGVEDWMPELPEERVVGLWHSEYHPTQGTLMQNR